MKGLTVNLINLNFILPVFVSNIVFFAYFKVEIKMSYKEKERLDIFEPKETLLESQ